MSDTRELASPRNREFSASKLCTFTFNSFTIHSQLASAQNAACLYLLVQCVPVENERCVVFGALAGRVWRFTVRLAALQVGAVDLQESILDRYVVFQLCNLDNKGAH